MLENYSFQGLLVSYLIQLVPVIITVIIIAIIAWFVLSKILKRFENKANERLSLERENSVILNKRLDELNERLMVIEKMLKEVE